MTVLNKMEDSVQSCPVLVRLFSFFFYVVTLAKVPFSLCFRFNAWPPMVIIAVDTIIQCRSDDYNETIICSWFLRNHIKKFGLPFLLLTNLELNLLSLLLFCPLYKQSLIKTDSVSMRFLVFEVPGPFTVNSLLTDTSLKRTCGVGPCRTSVIYFISLQGGHLSKADSRSWS